MTQRYPGKIAASFLDWRASQIGDPIARLRFLRRAVSTASAPRKRSFREHLALCLVLVVAGTAAVHRGTAISAAPHPTPAAYLHDTSRIWQVESTDEYESYSNGLRIEKRFATPNRPRPRYRVFDRNQPTGDHYQWRNQVAGIVFHTTESHMAPFERDANERLRRAGTSVLADVSTRRCYHYVIDRFGRVWRIVQESDVAWHAGKSVWADASGIYVNLNESFLGISFEGRTQSDGTAADTATEPQIHAARLLTDMLRAKYRIPAANCATHAQVSVSSENMRIGYHTDWAGNFPFAQLGLPDNYQEPLPALWTFGFEYDPIFIRVTGNRPWPGLTLAEQHIREQAALAGVSPAQYRQTLQQRYRRIILALYTADEEQRNNES